MARLPPIGNVPTRQDLELYRGATFLLPFTATNSSDVVLDITDYTIAARIRRYHMGPLVAEFDVVIEDAVSGLFYIEMTAADTALIKCGELPTDSASRYWWDLRVQGPGPAPFAGFIRYGEVFVHAQSSY